MQHVVLIIVIVVGPDALEEAAAVGEATVGAATAGAATTGAADVGVVEAVAVEVVVAWAATVGAAAASRPSCHGCDDCGTVCAPSSADAPAWPWFPAH